MEEQLAIGKDQTRIPEWSVRCSWDLLGGWQIFRTGRIEGRYRGMVDCQMSNRVVISVD